MSLVHRSAADCSFGRDVHCVHSPNGSFYATGCPDSKGCPVGFSCKDVSMIPEPVTEVCDNDPDDGCDGYTDDFCGN